MKSTAHTNHRRLLSIILAAGKGTRMQNPELPKVCFTIEDRPVITRAVEQYTRLGADANCVVIGAMADQVIEAVSGAFGKVMFCRQREQRGTGNAAKAAAEVLQASGFDGDLLVVAGDKVLEDSVVARLMDTFYEENSDLAFITGKIEDFPSSGRVITESNSSEMPAILGNVEIFDVARFELLQLLRRITAERAIPPEEAESLTKTYFKQEKKASKALGPLWELIKTGQYITSDLIGHSFSHSDFSPTVGGKPLTSDLIAGCKHANLSVYCFKAQALYDAMERFSSDNAQSEEYLTDAIGILASMGRKLNIVPIQYPEEAMAFNTPEELAAIRAYYTRKQSVTATETGTSIRTVSDWLEEFSGPSPAALKWLHSIYGEGNPTGEDKRRMIVSMLEEYLSFYGDEEVVISRAPARVNIMGRHVDHQGGHGNMIGIDRDTYLVTGKRNDRLVRLHNLLDHQFPDRDLDIDACLQGYEGDWVQFINCDAVKQRLDVAKGDWSEYITAGIVKLQTMFPDLRLPGMNVLAAGNVPIAAGLSSSSTLVVATAEAVVRYNNLPISSEQFVELCGEGEWYVGTRGGAGDHSAMKYAKRNAVTQVGFFPFEVGRSVPFPEDYRFVICNSQVKARKTEGARDIFNHRVACYHIGREIFKQEFPKHANVIHHLRDINTSNLGVDYAELLRMLKRLPEMITRSEIEARLPGEFASRYLNSCRLAPDTFQIRSVVMFGLAECERSRDCVDLLLEGNIEEFGQWMNISHNGDRVVYWLKGETSEPFVPDYSDEGIDELIRSYAGGVRKSALVRQPGSYSCSIPQIDRMVDITLRVPGVLGAQIAGAGLGGCIMVLVHKDACHDLELTMTRKYYEPNGLEPDVFTCCPVAGSGVATF